MWLDRVAYFVFRFLFRALTATAVLFIVALVAAMVAMTFFGAGLMLTGHGGAP